MVQRQFPETVADLACVHNLICPATLKCLMIVVVVAVVVVVVLPHSSSRNCRSNNVHSRFPRCDRDR